jgi:hypothetical protein
MLAKRDNQLHLVIVSDENPRNCGMVTHHPTFDWLEIKGLFYVIKVQQDVGESEIFLAWISEVGRHEQRLRCNTNDLLTFRNSRSEVPQKPGASGVPLL